MDRALVTRLSLRHFRNIAQGFLEPAERLNLICGDNGHGKTSLIEGLYVLCTTKSFRCASISETIQQGAEFAELAAEVTCLGLPQQLRAKVGERGRSFLLNGKRPKRHIDYALSTPVVAFHPGDLLLSSGPASARRTLLDRVGLHLDPAGAEARTRHQKALRERQRLLRQTTHSPQLDAYEQVAATSGARMAVSRQRSAARIIETFASSFSEVAPSDVLHKISYLPGGTTDAEVFARELFSRRAKDQLRGGATFGPGRDELQLVLDGRNVRSHASQGQQRLVALCLKLAELHCVRQVSGQEPLLLLDDVSSELDPERTESVFQFLRASLGQVFVTTTRPELFADVAREESSSAQFRVASGAVSQLS